MIDPAKVPALDENERLARYVFFRRHIRADQTVKPDAFMPHPHREMSVTRHRSATDDELWRIGEEVASLRQKTLYGRCDVQAKTYLRLNLKVVAAPIPSNPNHANVTDWPADKPTQKILAQEVAAVVAGSCGYSSNPELVRRT